MRGGIDRYGGAVSCRIVGKNDFFILQVLITFILVKR